MRVRITLMALAGVVFVTGCDKKEDEKAGKSIGAPAVEPPVSRNVPEGLSTASLRLDEAEAASPKANALKAVKDLLSTAGTGPSFVWRLKMIDGRVTELNGRAEDAPKACLADGIVSEAYNIGGALPGGQAAGMMFQCQEELGGGPAGGDVTNAQLAFGLTEDAFYLMERTFRSGTDGIVVLAESAMDGSGTEAWEINTSGDAADFKHIKAEDGVGLEATIAGSDASNGWAASCGLHVKSNDAHVYMKGAVAVGGECSEEIEACFDAKTGDEEDVSSCTEDGLASFELTSLTPELALAALDAAQAIVAKKITGNIDFTADAEVPEESGE